jgi:NADH-quinone oxidoreductase subunit M
VAPLFFIILLLSKRAGGSEDIRDMGGIAMRAPILATIFLIVALGTLAMPGSGNFVGEFLILLGLFQTKIVFAIVAFSGVVMASVYALRAFIRTMHNRTGPDVQSRELRFTDALVLVPLVLVIIFFALYPQLALHRSEASTKAAVAQPRAVIASPELFSPTASAFPGATTIVLNPHTGAIVSASRADVVLDPRTGAIVSVRGNRRNT